MTSPRIGVLVVAYNAAATLASVLDRIPEDFRSEIDQVMVSDDASSDSTFLIGVGYRETIADLPLVVVRQEENLGYGGNQKWGYRWAIEHGLDIVVLLHGDGQYAPELLPEMVAPLLDDRADAVMGSRMLDSGGARAGGMPLYKWVGNRILTTAQNRLVGTSLSEWHSGYRAYRVSALEELDLDGMSDDFDFDTQILLQLLDRHHRIAEIPIPTFYGDEISYVNGLRYAKDIMGHTVRHRLRRMGLGAGTAEGTYELEAGAGSSQRAVTAMVPGAPPRRVLDLSCPGGPLRDALRSQGHDVVAVDGADLDRGLPPEARGPFDVVVLVDVLEHRRDPGHLLTEIREQLAPDGRIVGTVPNFAHWYPRIRAASGRFDYDARGILDRGHVRFFTRRSFRRMVQATGYRVGDLEALGIPVDVLARGGPDSTPGSVLRVAGVIDGVAVRLWPTLFAYQFAFSAVPDPGG